MDMNIKNWDIPSGQIKIKFKYYLKYYSIIIECKKRKSRHFNNSSLNTAVQTLTRSGAMMRIKRCLSEKEARWT